jgi:hypothetical protein
MLTAELASPKAKKWEKTIAPSNNNAVLRSPISWTTSDLLEETPQVL